MDAAKWPFVTVQVNRECTRIDTGGMGSLNDLTFDEDVVDEEGGQLLDAVFRDMKLYHGKPEHRAQWRKLEEEHKDEPPPRIKHAFGKE